MRSKPFYTVDCETDPFKAGRVPVPFLWGIYRYDTEEYWECETGEEVANFFRYRKCLVYAHNGGKFDYHYLREYINSDDPIMVIAGRMAKFKIGEAEFRDSINILVNPLRAFAKEEIDYSKLEADVRIQHMDEIKRYLRSDCINLANTVQAYIDRFGKSLTQAGSSMRYWRKHYPTPMIPQTAQQSAYYREFYYGGRVQCFQSGHQRSQFELVDINSAYPYAMTKKHPLSPEAMIIDHLPGDEEKLGACLIRLDAIAEGCFPLRDEDGSLYFPEDELEVREYAITGWELIAALECDAVKIINIKEIRSFSQTVNFTDYITHFYNERKIAKVNNDKMGDVFAKLFMNSLYGKFASDPSKYHDYMIASDESVLKWTKQNYRYLKSWGERMLLERAQPEEKHRYYNVATAASITGFVRAHLFRAMRQCEGLLYCDTDSIAARKIDGLPLGVQLGEWKHELRCDEYAIAGKKLYAFHGVKPGDIEAIWEWKVACKGVNLTASQIIDVARGETIIYRPEVPTYSFHRDEPVFISRTVKNTVKNLASV